LSGRAGAGAGGMVVVGRRDRGSWRRRA
jgi:hypothetical protein